MKKIVFPDKTKLKEHILVDEELYLPENQNTMLYQLYLDNPFKEKKNKLTERQLKKRARIRRR